MSFRAALSRPDSDLFVVEREDPAFPQLLHDHYLNVREVKPGGAFTRCIASPKMQGVCFIHAPDARSAEVTPRGDLLEKHLRKKPEECCAALERTYRWPRGFRTWLHATRIYAVQENGTTRTKTERGR